VKRCGRCLAEKKLSQFSLSVTSDGGDKGYQRWCKACHAAYANEYREKNREYVALRDAAWRKKNKARIDDQTLARTYGITRAQYDALVAKQNGACAVCRKQLAPGVYTHIDHDHVSGHVRGVLCRVCNTSIGGLGDTVAGLRRALEYLEGAPA
jgi:hypothetical protein